MILRAIAKDRWSVLDPVCLFSFLHRCNIVIILLFLIFTAVFLDSPAEFTVDTRAVPKKPGDGPGKVSCLVNNPSGSRLHSFRRGYANEEFFITISVVLKILFSPSNS